MVEVRIRKISRFLSNMKARHLPGFFLWQKVCKHLVRNNQTAEAAA